MYEQLFLIMVVVIPFLLGLCAIFGCIITSLDNDDRFGYMAIVFVCFVLYAICLIGYVTLIKPAQ